MVPIVRSARFLLPATEKALPNRQPETGAQRAAHRMMTAGGAPTPTKQIQSGPIFCPDCGETHRLGTTCKAFKLERALAALTKGVVTSGNKRGNPYHDSSTGHFTSAPSTKSPTGGSSHDSFEQPMYMPGKTTEVDAGTAHTMEGKAPSKPANPDVTNIGKVGASPKPPAAGGTVAGKVNAAPSAKPSLSDANTVPPNEMSPGGNPGDRPKGFFSHDASNEAYKQAHGAALAGGQSRSQAHEAGMQAGQKAYMDSVRKLQPEAPQGASPPVRSATATMPDFTAPTQQGPAPGPSAPTQQGQAPPGGLEPPQAPPKPQQSPPIAPGQKTQPGFVQQVIQPWANYGTGSGIGGGMFTPGGTTAPTAGAAASGVHGLLNWSRGPNQPQQPAAMHRQKQLENIQNQSGFLQNQQTQYLNRLRNFTNRGNQ